MKIKGKYNIADCEHRGDIANALDYVSKCGCKVTGHYWDGKDCGVAYVEFECSADIVRKLYKSISFRFDCDLASIIDFRQSAIDELKNSRYNVVDSADYEVLRNKYATNYDYGFERCLPIELVFEIDSYSIYNTPKNKVDSFMCHNYNGVLKVECCKIDGDKYTFLLLCDGANNMQSAIEMIKVAGLANHIHELYINQFGNKEIKDIPFWDWYNFKQNLMLRSQCIV